MLNKSIQGVIYALPKYMIDRIFDEGRDVYVKYLSKEPSKKSKIKLYKGMKLYFYASQHNKSILGEATINDILFLNKNELRRNLMNRLILDTNELTDYCSGREEKKMLALIIKNLKKYNKPICLKQPVNMGGLYITDYNKEALGFKDE